MATPPPSRPRLGRGLNALFTATPTPAVELPADSAPPSPVSADQHETLKASANASQTVRVDAVDVNPHQPRRIFDDASLQELAASLKMNGLIQPIIVRPVGERFELIAGERRLRAARLAGFADVPAVIRNVDGPTQAQWALVENIQRENLNPIDRAIAYQGLLTHLGLTQAELANRLGEQRSSVANYLRLLELQPDVREWVAGGKLSLGHAKVLASVTDAPEQVKLAQLVVSQELSVRELERLTQKHPENTSGESTVRQSSAHLQDLERRLTQHVGLRIAIQKSAGKGKGKVVIHYASLDQFDELLRKLGYSADE